MQQQPASDTIHDLVGVGIGPSNLSLAALLHDQEEVSAVFLEAKEKFNWHKGLMFDDANLVVSFVKDLVTLADPTNRFSFLSFLFETGRIYRALNAKFNTVKLKEFEQYLSWVANQMDSCQFGHAVNNINFSGDHFSVETKGNELKTRNLVLGVGRVPVVPEELRGLVGKNFFHCFQYLNYKPELKGKRVAIIGGGQSGAEVFREVLKDQSQRPAAVNWISARNNFQPLDDSTFTNEWFTPRYSDVFYGYDKSLKGELLKQQTLASDGIHEGLLKQLYQQLYQMEFLEQVEPFWNLCPSTKMTRAEHCDDRGCYKLTVNNLLTDRTRELDVDVVILCTGFGTTLPSFLDNIIDRVALDNGNFIVNEDFSIKWDGPEECKIYVQNNAQSARGIADPNLSLTAWRSSMISNSLLGRERFKTKFDSSVLSWD